MNKSELVAKMAEDAAVTKAQAEKCLNSFMTAVEETVKKNEKVTLIGFGTFASVTRAARTGRNPQTGKEIKIAAKTNAKFTPGAALKDLTTKKAAPSKGDKGGKAAKPAAKAAKKK